MQARQYGAEQAETEDTHRAILEPCMNIRRLSGDAKPKQGQRGYKQKSPYGAHWFFNNDLFPLDAKQQNKYETNDSHAKKQRPFFASENCCSKRLHQINNRGVNRGIGTLDYTEPPKER